MESTINLCVWKELTLRVSSDYDECESSDHGPGQISCCNACTENSAPLSPHLGLQKRQIHLSVLPDRSIFMPFDIQWGYWQFGWHQHTQIHYLHKINTTIGPKIYGSYYLHMPNKCAEKAPLHFLYDLKWNHWQIKNTVCICVFQKGIHTNLILKHFLYNTANHNLVTILTGCRINDGEVGFQCRKDKQILNLLTATKLALGSITFHIWRASKACGRRNYKSCNTLQFCLIRMASPPLISSFAAFNLHFQVLSGVFGLCWLGGRQKRWPGALVIIYTYHEQQRP
jgi:hypothetical protein